MNNQHVKIKASMPMASNDGEQKQYFMNDRSVRASINPQNEQIAQANHPVQGHKKANSLMNQKMMQLLMNKDYVGSNQSNINQQALKQDHLVKSHFIEPTKSNTAQANQKLNC